MNTENLSHMDILFGTMLLQALMAGLAIPAGAIAGWHWDNIPKWAHKLIYISSIILISPWLLQTSYLIFGRWWE